MFYVRVQAGRTETNLHTLFFNSGVPRTAGEARRKSVAWRICMLKLGGKGLSPVVSRGYRGGIRGEGGEEGWGRVRNASCVAGDDMDVSFVPISYDVGEFGFEAEGGGCRACSGAHASASYVYKRTEARVKVDWCSSEALNVESTTTVAYGHQVCN